MGFWRNVGNFITFGTIDRRDAKRITRNAKHRAEDAKEELEEQRCKTQEAMESLGNKKSGMYKNSLFSFATMYQKIGKVDLKPLKENDDLFSIRKFKGEIKEIKTVSTSMKEIAVTAGGGALVGAIAAGSTYGLVSVLGTA
ncbi:MAG: hypothetical protein ACR2PY_07910, partial [Salinispira sp.]